MLTQLLSRLNLNAMNGDSIVSIHAPYHFDFLSTIQAIKGELKLKFREDIDMCLTR